jgi:hypothetical protein
LSFKSVGIGIVAAQAVLFSLIFQLSNRAAGSFQISEP